MDTTFGWAEDTHSTARWTMRDLHPSIVSDTGATDQPELRITGFAVRRLKMASRFAQPFSILGIQIPADTLLSNNDLMVKGGLWTRSF
jgi:hypothetical protein